MPSSPDIDAMLLAILRDDAAAFYLAEEARLSQEQSHE